ncbi:hypothetical protein CXG81DRAFT_17960 [Caulochytrium protostelioides]|uniref:Peptidase S59 domain-containing protein n=1 Tax=Caulochytrium protostelioides TaxID=1555241 RepID=A0A4P9XAK8_9FUNG|nr:hypothetical protein CXG81DRAFT_17960 [Caulochytrium protostelioides]|eukprot:RKP02365.1 hypothetical protein CXG81DRAFT_17960 [Caulochytrium protostelioides]
MFGSSGLFGAGANPAGGSAFGQQQQQQPPPQPTSAFGQPAAAGAGAFGRPAFGAAPAPAFGQPQGAPSTGFGAPAAAPPANTGFGFGASAATAARPVFGAPQPAAAAAGGGMFGAPAASAATTGFGAAAAPAGGMFGATANPQPGGAFGAAAPTSAFGAPAAGGFGATSGGFGAAPGATPMGPAGGAAPGGAFGQSNVGGMAPTTAQQNNGTGNPSYAPTQDRDGNAQPLTFHTISANPSYQNWSFEELRVQDYIMGKKKPGSNTGFGNTAFGGVGTAPGAFGQPQAGQPGATTGGLFGQPASQTGGFGSTATGGFGAQAHQQPGAAGGGLFGQPAGQTGFGGGAAGAFGAPAAQQSGPTGFGFGSTAPAGAAGATGGFGASGGFGQQPQQQQQSGLFGAPKTTGFGATGTQPFGAPSTGGGLFGQQQPQQQQQQQQPAAGGFGQPAAGNAFAFGAKPAGGGLFGSTQQQQPAAAGFGQPQPGVGGFGQPAASQPGGGLFGAAAPKAAPAFGAPASSQPGGFGFGQPQQPQQPGQPSAFGQPATSQPGGASLFGNPAGGGGAFGAPRPTGGFGQPASSQPGGGLFGAAPPATSQPGATGFGFGAAGGHPATSAPAAGGLFGAVPPAGSQPGGGLFGGAGAAKPLGGGGGLFGSAQPASAPLGGGGLFGNLGANSGAQAPSLFAQAPAGGLGGMGAGAGGGLFGGAPNAGTKMVGLGGAPAASAPGLGGGFFGSQPGATGAYGASVTPMAFGAGLGGAGTPASGAYGAGGGGGMTFNTGFTPGLPGFAGSMAGRPPMAGQGHLQASLSTSPYGYNPVLNATSGDGASGDGLSASASAAAANRKPMGGQHTPVSVPHFRITPRRESQIKLTAGTGTSGLYRHSASAADGSAASASAASAASARQLVTGRRSPFHSVPAYGAASPAATGVASATAANGGAAFTFRRNVKRLDLSAITPHATTPFKHATPTAAATSAGDGAAGSHASLEAQIEHTLQSTPRRIPPLVAEVTPAPARSAKPLNSAAAPAATATATPVTKSAAAGGTKADAKSSGPAAATAAPHPKAAASAKAVEALKSPVAATATASSPSAGDGATRPATATTPFKKPRYVTTPSMDALRGMSDAALRAVADFQVELAGVGRIRFLEPVDLLSSAPDGTARTLHRIPGELIIFSRRNIVVYPDEELKHPPGMGLNVPAEIHLEQCWPLDKADQQPITDGGDRRVKRHVATLQRMPETTFLGYEPIQGIWKFRVEHFSRYGLDDEESDEESDDEAGGRPVRGTIAHTRRHLQKQQSMAVGSTGSSSKTMTPATTRVKPMTQPAAASDEDDPDRTHADVDAVLSDEDGVDHDDDVSDDVVLSEVSTRSDEDHDDIDDEDDEATVRHVHPARAGYGLEEAASTDSESVSDRRSDFHPSAPALTSMRSSTPRRPALARRPPRGDDRDDEDEDDVADRNARRMTAAYDEDDEDDAMNDADGLEQRQRHAVLPLTAHELAHARQMGLHDADARARFLRQQQALSIQRRKAALFGGMARAPADDGPASRTASAAAAPSGFLRDLAPASPKRRASPAVAPATPSAAAARPMPSGALALGPNGASWVATPAAALQSRPVAPFSSVRPASPSKRPLPTAGTAMLATTVTTTAPSATSATPLGTAVPSLDDAPTGAPDQTDGAAAKKAKPSATVAKPAVRDDFWRTPQSIVNGVAYRHSVAHATQASSIHDAAVFRGRAFRAGWGPGFTFVAAHGTRVVLTTYEPFAHARSNPDPPTSASSSLANAPRAPMKPSGHYLGNETPYLQAALDTAVTSRSDAASTARAPRSRWNCSFKEWHARHIGTSARSLWHVLDALFTPVTVQNAAAMRVEQRRVVEQTLRREQLSHWLQTMLRHSDPGLLRHAGPADATARAIFEMLLTRRLEDAVKLCLRSHNVQLGLLIAQLGGAGAVSSLSAAGAIDPVGTDERVCEDVSRQVATWQAAGLPMAYLPIYQLVAGNLSLWTADLFDCLPNWCWVFGLFLWYKDGGVGTFDDALAAYDEAVADGSVAPARPVGIVPPGDAEDWLLSLCRLRQPAAHDALDVMLNWPSHTTQPMDVSAAWFVHQLLAHHGVADLSDARAPGVPSVKSESLTLDYVSLLAAHGHDRWALFVATFLVADATREAVLRHLLVLVAPRLLHPAPADATAAPSEPALTRAFLVERLQIPATWVDEARLVVTRYTNDRVAEFECLLALHAYPEAHGLFLEHFLGRLVVHRELRLRHVLDALVRAVGAHPARRVPAWAHGAGWVHDYFALRDAWQRALAMLDRAEREDVPDPAASVDRALQTFLVDRTRAWLERCGAAAAAGPTRGAGDSGALVWSRAPPLYRVACLTMANTIVSLWARGARLAANVDLLLLKQVRLSEDVLIQAIQATQLPTQACS